MEAKQINLNGQLEGEDKDPIAVKAYEDTAKAIQILAKRGVQCWTKPSDSEKACEEVMRANAESIYNLLDPQDARAQCGAIGHLAAANVHLLVALQCFDPETMKTIEDAYTPITKAMSSMRKARAAMQL